MKVQIIFLLLCLSIFLSGCSSYYVVPEGECPITAYLIENATEEFEPIFISGYLRHSSDIFDDPEMTGYGLISGGTYYSIIDNWDGPIENPPLKEEDIQKLENLVGKWIKFGGVGTVLVEGEFVFYIISHCNYY